MGFSRNFRGKRTYDFSPDICVFGLRTAALDIDFSPNPLMRVINLAIIVDTSFDRDNNSFESSTNVKFFENAVQMTFDRFLADKKGLGNLLVCETFREQTENFLIYHPHSQQEINHGASQLAYASWPFRACPS